MLGEGGVCSASQHWGVVSAEYWEHLFLSLQRYYHGEGVTGLLLLYPTYVVHTVEVCMGLTRRGNCWQAIWFAVLVTVRTWPRAERSI